MLVSASSFAYLNPTELNVCTSKSTLAAIENGSVTLSNLCSYYCDNSDKVIFRQLENSLGNYDKNVFAKVCTTLDELNN